MKPTKFIVLELEPGETVEDIHDQIEFARCAKREINMVARGLREQLILSPTTKPFKTSDMLAALKIRFGKFRGMDL